MNGSASVIRYSITVDLSHLLFFNPGSSLLLQFWVLPKNLTTYVLFLKKEKTMQLAIQNYLHLWLFTNVFQTFYLKFEFFPKLNRLQNWKWSFSLNLSYKRHKITLAPKPCDILSSSKFYPLSPLTWYEQS